MRCRIFGFRIAALGVMGLGLPGRFPNSPIRIAGFTYQPARVARDSQTDTRTAALVAFELAVEVRTLLLTVRETAAEVSRPEEVVLLLAVLAKTDTDTALESAVAIGVAADVATDVADDWFSDNPTDVPVEAAVEPWRPDDVAFESEVEVRRD